MLTVVLGVERRRASVWGKQTCQEGGENIVGIPLDCRKLNMLFDLVEVFDFNVFK